MHSSIVFPAEYQSLLNSLHEPLHSTSRRNPSRQPEVETELSLSCGYRIDPGHFSKEPHLSILLDDLKAFLHTVMGVSETPGGIPISFERDEAGSKPSLPDTEEHLLLITSFRVILRAQNINGLRRAIFRIQDEMLIRSAPIVPLGSHRYSTSLHRRISRNPLAPYRWLSGWELEDDVDYYPEAYLSRIAHAGVNALWIPALFRNLIASQEIPELGPPEHRLDKLRRIVERADRYGIHIYLFCIEPRALPAGHPVLHLYPELIGAHRSLCVTHPRVRSYLHEACRSLAAEVPALGGVINIFCGERYSNCWSNNSYVQACPRCSERTQADVHSSVLNSMIQGLRLGSPAADLLAWTYLMASSTESLPIAPMLKVMESTDPRVIWLGNYEHGASKMACGRNVQVHEYSLSCIGPSPHFLDLATAANHQDRTLYAKLQLGNSYELSSLPWLTVPGIVTEKITSNKDHGIQGAMLGWLVGGVPGPMLKAAGEAAFSSSPQGALHRTAAIDWGEENTSAIVEAWTHFAEAWVHYPFHNAILYWGPLTRAPAYLLYLEQESRLAQPYNWGYDRQRHRQPYENHPHRWLGNYSAEEIIAAFRDMADRWERGLILLRQVMSSTLTATAMQLSQWRIAEATRLQLLAAANIYEFNTLRLSLLGGDETVMPRMHAIAKDELALTQVMMTHMRAEPWIGYQSEIFAHSYSIPMLEEKCHQVNQTLDRLRFWQKHGVERWVLEKQIADIEAERPDDWPDVFGD